MGNFPFITGTGAYGPFDNNCSDIDLVMMAEDAESFRQLLKNAGVKTYSADERYDNPGFFFDFYGRDINVIIMEDWADYYSWKITTNIFQATKPVQEREARVQNFQLYREAELKAIRRRERGAKRAKRCYVRLWRWLRKPIGMGGY